MINESFPFLISLPCHKLMRQPGFYTRGILCGLALTFGACTTSPSVHDPSASAPNTHRGAPPSSQNVEVQLLQTLETAESLGDGNPLLLSSLYSLAAYYQEQGEVGKAEFQYKRALTLKEQMSGPEHPDVAMILHNYAGLLREAHRYQEAENLSARANAILAKRSSVPPSH